VTEVHIGGEPRSHRATIVPRDNWSGRTNCLDETPGPPVLPIHPPRTMTQAGCDSVGSCLTPIATVTSPRSPSSAGVTSLVDGFSWTSHSVLFVATGSAVGVCSAAVNADSVNADSAVGDQWEGIVVKDETATSLNVTARWLVCHGGSASGIGAVVLCSTNSRNWRMTPLGLGGMHHAGDALDAAVFDAPRAAVTFDSLVGEDRDYAVTKDGGRMWTTVTL
jgi:hypothetical protein